jgi:hypothetical protein
MGFQQVRACRSGYYARKSENGAQRYPLACLLPSMFGFGRSFD